jgi:hypothetical protein
MGWGGERREKKGLFHCYLSAYQSACDTQSIFIEHFLCLSDVWLRAKKIPVKHDTEILSLRTLQVILKLDSFIHSFIHLFIHLT